MRSFKQLKNEDSREDVLKFNIMYQVGYLRRVIMRSLIVAALRNRNLFEGCQSQNI